MDQIPQAGSPKWNIISLYMELLMIYPSFIMISYIWIWNDGNGGNGEKKACQGYVSWTQFVAELYDHFDFDTHHLVRLNKLKQFRTME